MRVFENVMLWAIVLVPLIGAGAFGVHLWLITTDLVAHGQVAFAWAIRIGMLILAGPIAYGTMRFGLAMFGRRQ